MTLAYRMQEPEYQNVWDWDIIIYPDRSVRILGISSECATHQEDSYLHGRCQCPRDRPRMSSPVVDEFMAPIREIFDGNMVGSARHLLDAVEGTTVPVLSGKTYRLIGPRVPQTQLMGASIWDIYRKKDEGARPLSLLERFKEWWNL